MKQIIGFITFLCLPALMLDAKPPRRPQQKVETAPTELQRAPSPVRSPVQADISRITNSLLTPEFRDLTQEETQFDLPPTEDSQPNFQESEQIGQKYCQTPTASDPRRSKTPPLLPEGWETALVDPKEAIVHPSVQAKIERAVAYAEDISVWQRWLQFYEENVKKTYKKQQVAMMLKVPAYIILTNEIETGNFEDFIKFFNEKEQDGAGIRLIDKAIHQAVIAEKSTALEAIMTAADHYGFLDLVGALTREKATDFLIIKAQEEKFQLTADLEKRGNRIAKLTKIIIATRAHELKEAPFIYSESGIQTQSRKAAQEFTNFASGKRLLLKSPPTSPREE